MGVISNFESKIVLAGAFCEPEDSCTLIPVLLAKIYIGYNLGYVMGGYIKLYLRSAIGKKYLDNIYARSTESEYTCIKTFDVGIVIVVFVAVAFISGYCIV